MLLGYRGINAIFLGDHRIGNLRYAAADASPRRSTTRCCLNVSPNYNAEKSMARIKEMFNSKIELSASAYDTAWVAMVPSRDSPNKPSFPQCLNWIMENQHQDGSWGLNPTHPLLLKDHLSCTMACVLALTKWRVGEEFVQRGLQFIGSSQGLITISNEAHHLAPIGFDIVFPSMMKEAIELGVNLSLDHVLMDRMISNRTSVIERNKGKIGVVGYVGEGLVKESFVWEEMMRKHQRSNGSFFNSPATTAAALIHHHHDHKCFQYLCSLVKEYTNGVPTVHSMEIYGRLCMVDTLERLGVERYFMQEIETVLNDTYRHWQLKSEEIFWDVNCCAMAFRLLRMHGYEVSSDELERFSDEEQFFESTSMQYTSLVTILELYKASVLLKHLNHDKILEKIHAWTTSYLRQQLLDKKILDGRLCKEVEYALKDINGTVLERIQSRQSIDLYDVENFEMLKTSHRCSNFINQDFLTFSIHDFNKCQGVLRDELESIERWYKENRLDQIKDTRKVLHPTYFLIAADLFNPQLSEARISYALIVILTTVFDDLCDKCASEKELLNIIDLVKKWDEPSDGDDYCSIPVEIFVSALRTTTNDIATKASIKQGRSVKNHIIRGWIEILESMMGELEWWKNGVKPTMDEYLSVACLSIASTLIQFPAFCLLGPELPEEVFCSKEYNGLTKHVSILCRLQNDLQTYKKEMEERKINSISLQLCQADDHIHGEVITLEVAIEKVKGMVEMSRRELLQMVLQTKESQVPKVCKDLCWTTNKLLDFAYSNRDEFSYPKEITDHMNKIIYEPINLPPSQQKINLRN